jgi:hypothetical protein
VRPAGDARVGTEHRLAHEATEPSRHLNDRETEMPATSLCTAARSPRDERGIRVPER